MGRRESAENEDRQGRRVEAAMEWSVPRMWEGKTVAILGSGPSMSKAVAERIHAAAIPTIAINTTFRLAPWADMIYAADARWWSVYERAVQDFPGLKVTCEADAPFHTIPDLRLLKQTGRTGFDPDPTCVRTGGNSGYQSIHVAVHAGARRILLCGFDMRGEGHWHGLHPDPLRNAGEEIFTRWFEWYATLFEALEPMDVEVLNCTPRSALPFWPVVDLEEALSSVPA